MWRTYIVLLPEALKIPLRRLLSCTARNFSGVPSEIPGLLFPRKIRVYWNKKMGTILTSYQDKFFVRGLSFA